MTGAPTPPAVLRAYCDAHGIRLALADGGGLAIDAPAGALTPDLLERLTTHKGELLAMLRAKQTILCPWCRGTTLVDGRRGVWCTDCERLAWLYEPSVAIIRADHADHASIDPPDPCRECGTLELWQTLADTWRCLRCDPPIKGQRLRSLASRLAPRGTGATSDTPDDSGIDAGERCAEPILERFPLDATPRDSVCRCGSTTWRDVVIHGGQSVRRDCTRCKRFLDFPLWYGKDTRQEGQYPR